MSEPEVCSQYLCLHEVHMKGIKGGFSYHLSFLCFLWKPSPALGFILGSIMNLLCDISQITFPLWASMFPSGNRAFGGHSDGPYLISCTFNSSLLSISLLSVLHNKLGAHSGTQEGHSQCFGEKDVYNNCYSLLGTCWVSDSCWGLPYLILGTQPRKWVF